MNHPPRLTGCHDCGTLQRVPPMAGRNLLSCARCHATLERTNGRSLAAALACSAAALLLLIPANVLPFLTTSILGVSRESVLGSSATAMLHDGFPELGAAVALFVIVLPPLRFGLLTAVLATLHLGRRPRWLGPAFRATHALQTWAMADVFLLGFVVAFARLQTSISVQIGAGAFCFVGAAILTLLTRATLDTGAVWRAIAPERTPPADAPAFACPTCELVLPAHALGSRCPRCATTLLARKPAAVSRAAALMLAAAVLYIPANLYPMATLPIGFSSVEYTVIEGVIDLFDAGLVGLALLVLTASFAIPLAKLVVLAWCIVSVLRRSPHQLVLKTRLYNVVEEIGRWSMIDPFVIACFVPVTQYNALVRGSAEPALPIFAAVVILTTLAARAFDPRLMWDAALEGSRR